MAQYLDGTDLDRLLCAFRRERLDACPELVGSPSQTLTESCLDGEAHIFLGQIFPPALVESRLVLPFWRRNLPLFRLQILRSLTLLLNASASAKSRPARRTSG